MHSLEIDKKNKLDISELDLLLMLEMGFFSNLKKMKIGFDPKPFSKPTNQKENKKSLTKETFVDLHLEIVNKIDELLDVHKKKVDIPSFNTTSQSEISFEGPVEIKNTNVTPTTFSHFQENLFNSADINIDLDLREEFFEIEPPKNTPNDFDLQKDNEIHSWMIGDSDSKTKRSFWGLSKIKVRKNEGNKKMPKNSKESKKTNGVTRTSLELEKTKQEIEAKKKALEDAKKKEKEKIIELKIKKEEKKKREKLKKLELKKKEKEDKLRQKLAEKEKRLHQQKIKEDEKKKQEKLKKIEQEKKKAEIAEKKIQQIKIAEQKKIEKIKMLESQKKSKEKIKRDKKKERIQTEEEPADLGTYIKDKKVPIQQHVSWDEDVEKLLPILDNLFGSLPDEIVDEFTQSNGFKLYEKVMSKYKHK